MNSTRLKNVVGECWVFEYIFNSDPNQSIKPLPRALSDAQEKAQLLAGSAMPEAVLKSLLNGSSVGEKIYILNLSPYDGCLEKVVLQLKDKIPGYQARMLSLSTDVATTCYCEKLVAFFLMEDMNLF